MIRQSKPEQYPSEVATGTAACSASVQGPKNDSNLSIPKHTLLQAQWSYLEENFCGHKERVELRCHDTLQWSDQENQSNVLRNLGAGQPPPPVLLPLIKTVYQNALYCKLNIWILLRDMKEEWTRISRKFPNDWITEIRVCPSELEIMTVLLCCCLICM